MEVLDLNKLLEVDDQDPFLQKYRSLNRYRFPLSAQPPQRIFCCCGKLLINGNDAL